jgi:hypothetical protein
MRVLATTSASRIRRLFTPDGAGAEPIMSDGKTPCSLSFHMDQCRLTEKVCNKLVAIFVYVVAKEVFLVET